MKPSCYFVHSEAYKQYKFNEEHPFNQKRLDLTLDLMEKFNLITQDHFVEPRYATIEELELIH